MAAVATSLVPVALLVLHLYLWSFSGLSPSSPASFLTLPPKNTKASSVQLFILSSWSLGLFSFVEKWLMGFLSFWHRRVVCAVRLGVLPWHVFIGLYTYGLAVATAETGLLEKLTFLQTERNVSKHCPESTLVNILGLGLALVLWRCNFGCSFA